MTLNPANGSISGTPTASGTFNFTVTATDSTGGQAVSLSSGCSITIAPPTITAECVSATTGTVGAPYSSAITVTGGTAPYTFAIASGALPAGLTLNPTTGAITGTPTTGGPFSFTVKVTDSTPGVHATTTTSNCIITVTPPVLCVPTTFDLTGNTASTGTSGNIRTFTAPNGVQVKASAFSRNKSTGAWSTAYLPRAWASPTALRAVPTRAIR